MERKIKILAVLSGLSAGGAETMYINLYRQLDKSKYEIDFLIFGDDNAFYAKEVKDHGSRIFKMASIRENGIKGFCKSVKKAIIENGPYDVVHSHIDYLSGFVMKIAKKCNVKIRLAHSHNTSAYTHRGSLSSLLMLYIRRLINRNATNRLACSTDAAEYMFGSKEAIIINNAIDLNRFTDIGQYADSLDNLRMMNKKIILHIGRFVEQKNHKGLISIYKEYVKRNNDAVLLLVGDGALKSEVEQLVKDYGLSDNIIFLGLRSDIAELMALADVFVLPSNFEGLPVTLIEAQAMNVPCVVSDNIKREVDCGINLISFIPLNDECAWINAIENAIQNREHNNNFNVMTERGYNIDSNVDIIERLYSNNN